MNLSHTETQIAIRRYARRYRLSARVVGFNSVLRYAALRSYRNDVLSERYSGHQVAA